MAKIISVEQLEKMIETLFVKLCFFNSMDDEPDKHKQFIELHKLLLKWIEQYYSEISNKEIIDLLTNKKKEV